MLSDSDAVAAVEAAYDELRLPYGDSFSAPAFSDLWADSPFPLVPLFARAFDACWFPLLEGGLTEADAGPVAAAEAARSVARALIALDYGVAYEGAGPACRLTSE